MTSGQQLFLLAPHYIQDEVTKDTQPLPNTVHISLHSYRCSYHRFSHGHTVQRAGLRPPESDDELLLETEDKYELFRADLGDDNEDVEIGTCEIQKL